MKNNIFNYSNSYDSVIGNELWKTQNLVSEEALILTYSFYKIPEFEINLIIAASDRDELSSIEKNTIKQALEGDLLINAEKNAIIRFFERNEISDIEKNAVKNLLKRNELSFIEKFAVKQALTEWENVVDIKFREINNYEQSNIKFRKDALATGINGNSYITTCENKIEAACITLNNKNFNNNNLHSLEKGNQGFKTIIHEIGHALGLKHPTKKSEFDNPPFLIKSKDYSAVTIMSYESMSKMPNLFSKINLKYRPDSKLNFNKLEDNFYPCTPSVFDIAAIQKIYGANMSFNSGNNLYNFNDDCISKQFFTIWDPSGINILDAAQTVSDNIIDLRPGELHISNIGNRYFSLAYGSKIEEFLSGSGNDVIVAYYDNIIHTGSGNDIIYLGYGESNIIYGGQGEKKFIIDNNNLNKKKSISKIYDFKNKIDKICFTNYDNKSISIYEMVDKFGDINTQIKFDSDKIEIILQGVLIDPNYNIVYD